MSRTTLNRMTPAQRRVYDFIAEFSREHGYPPTRSEIAGGLGFASPNAAECHIACLKRLGALWVGAGGARKLTINPAWQVVAP